MKIHFDIDCTPEEARTFVGLPDVAPLHQAFVDEMQRRMSETLANIDPEAMVKAWMPEGMAGWEEWQKMWRQAASGGTPKG